MPVACFGENWVRFKWVGLDHPERAESRVEQEAQLESKLVYTWISPENTRVAGNKAGVVILNSWG